MRLFFGAYTIDFYAQDVPENSQSNNMSNKEYYLTTILEGIRRGDAEAARQFKRLYSDGIRLYVTRRLGPEHLEERVRQLLDLLIERIRGGWHPLPGHLPDFLRKATAAWHDGNDHVISPTHERIQAKAKVLRKALKGCSKRDLEMLIRYHVNGQDMQQVLDSVGGSKEDFTQLQSRLRQLVSKEGGDPHLASEAAAGG